jgi:cytochrome c553
MAIDARQAALPACGESIRTAARRGRAQALAAGAAALVIAATAAGAAAQDAAAGRQKALQCQGCHGLDGLAKIPGAPHLAGQVQEYLVTAMRDYSSGARKNEMMTVAMRQLTEGDIEDLAAYYAGLDPRAKAEQ